MQARQLSRKEREQELRRLWKDRNGQYEVLRLFRRLRSDDSELQAGDSVIDLILNREYGVIVLAEGLAEYLPLSYLTGIPRDEHGHISVADVNLARTVSKLVAEECARQTGRKRKMSGLRLGDESRCAPPHAFDVMLGSQLGVGAYRALVEESLNDVMVSLSGQLELVYVPFDTLVDPETLVTIVRSIQPGSDFHRLARFF